MKLIFSFIADEEVGGHDGMEKYVVSKEFKELNIGFALDEGLASEENAIPVFYGERNVFWVQFKCHGTLFIINLGLLLFFSVFIYVYFYLSYRSKIILDG